MVSPSIFTFADLQHELDPFPHCFGTDTIIAGIDAIAHDWLTKTNAWHITHEDFYDQYEFSLLDNDIPTALSGLTSAATIASLQSTFTKIFNISHIEVVGITAHKLIHGQRIAIHNDFVEDEETHRFVLHLNHRWNEQNGGFLMLFNSANADDVSKVILPRNNTGFGFEISRKSHHAVSQIHNLDRYSIVYSFKAIR